jgi:aryl-alcohol dehydrogenase-like predicted oxidoreductase
MSFDNDSNLTRRHVLHGGLLAGLSAAIPDSLLAAERKLPVIYKGIPSTGQKLPVIGVGADQLGVQGDFTVVRNILKRMYELGGTVIDTAHRYGDTEIQVGKTLGELGLRDRMFICTKFNAPGMGGPQDQPGGKESIDLSFQRLPKIDLMYIHMMNSVESMMPLLQDLKQQRKVRYIGITCVPSPKPLPQMAEYIRKYPMDFIQVAYNLGDRVVEDEVLPLAQERRIAVIAAHPLGRNSLLKNVVGKPLPGWAADFDIASWGQYLLKYVVSHPAITCAIPGTTKIEHLEDNLAAAHGRLPDAATRKKMEAYWKEVAA